MTKLYTRDQIIDFIRDHESATALEVREAFPGIDYSEWLVDGHLVNALTFIQHAFDEIPEAPQVTMTPGGMGYGTTTSGREVYGTVDHLGGLHARTREGYFDNYYAKDEMQSWTQLWPERGEVDSWATLREVPRGIVVSSRNSSYSNKVYKNSFGELFEAHDPADKHSWIKGVYINLDSTGLWCRYASPVEINVDLMEPRFWVTLDDVPEGVVVRHAEPNRFRNKVCKLPGGGVVVAANPGHPASWVGPDEAYLQGWPRGDSGPWVAYEGEVNFDDELIARFDQ